MILFAWHDTLPPKTSEGCRGWNLQVYIRVNNKDKKAYGETGGKYYVRIEELGLNIFLGMCRAKVLQYKTDAGNSYHFHLFFLLSA